MTRRVAVIASHPIQHFCPLYAALARQPGIELRVGFASSAGLEPYFDEDFGQQIQWRKDLLHGFDHVFLAGADNRPPRHPIGPGPIWRFLDRSDPDVVLVYGLKASHSWPAVAWTRVRRRKLLVQTDAEQRSVVRSQTLLRRATVLPPLLSLVDGALVVGDENERYYTTYGMPRKKLHRCPFPCDTDQIDRTTVNRDELLHSHHLGPGQPLAIVVGKLVTRKDPLGIMQAFRQLPPSIHLNLAFVGDGPARPSLDALPVGSGRQAIVTGFQPPEELFKYYLAADFIVHAAWSDHHPLAISEAVYCGLPVVCSSSVGSIGPEDDVQPHRNARIFPPGDYRALSDALATLATDDDLRARYSEASHQIGAMHRIDNVTSAFMQAVEYLFTDAGSSSTPPHSDAGSPYYGHRLASEPREPPPP